LRSGGQVWIRVDEQQDITNFMVGHELPPFEAGLGVFSDNDLLLYCRVFTARDNRSRGAGSAKPII
jgi:hypothetical protein